MLAESKKNRTTPFRGAVRRLLGQRYSTGVDDRALTPPSDLIEPSAPTPDTRARRSARRRRLPGPYPDGQTPDAHAGRFLELLQERGITGDIIFEDIFGLYHKLLATIGWTPRPWAPVGRELRKLLGGKKTYAWFKDADGGSHRLRVYRVPRDLAGALICARVTSADPASRAMVRAA